MGNSKYFPNPSNFSNSPRAAMFVLQSLMGDYDVSALLCVQNSLLKIILDAY